VQRPSDVTASGSLIGNRDRRVSPRFETVTTIDSPKLV